jgi:BASS family bile acid:Na+ symporter
VLVVLAAAALALLAPGPGRSLAAHHGVDVALAALVLVTALAIPRGAVAALAAHRGRLTAILVITPAVLVGLAWGVSHLVSDPTLRRGVLALGLAPAEVASVAAVGVADGDTAWASGLLIGSTLLTVVLAGPVLRLLAPGAGRVDVGSVVANLAVVVALPLLVGLVLRPLVSARRWWPEVSEVAPVALVTVLVFLVASEVHFSRAYVGVVVALVGFVAGSTLLGLALGRGPTRPAGMATVLSTSMRDFAVAAGIAVAAFGVAAAAPLGVYGVLVIVWGLTLASVLRRRGATDSPG